MRYMMMIKATKESEAGIFPGPEFVSEMGKVVAELVDAGILLMTGGLQPSANGARITYSGGTRTVIDGPFTETKELIGGFAIVEAKSREAAIALATRIVDLHIKFGIDGEMEIRPMFVPPHANSDEAEGGCPGLSPDT